MTKADRLLSLMEKHKDISITVWIEVARLLGFRLKIELIDKD